MTEQELLKEIIRAHIYRRAKELFQINITYFLIFGEREWKILTGQIKLLKFK